MAEGGTRQKSKSRLALKPAFFYSSLLCYLASACKGRLTLHSQYMVALQHVCTMQLSGLCSAKMSQIAAAILTRNQKPYRCEYSTVAGLFIPAKMFFRHKRIPPHAQHLANKLSKSTLCKVLPCGYTTLHLKSWVFPVNKSHLGLNCVIPSTRPTSWDDGNHLIDKGPNTYFTEVTVPNQKLKYAEGRGLGGRSGKSFLRSIVLQENSQSALSH